MPILVIHAGSSVALALIGRLLQFPKVTMMRVDGLRMPPTPPADYEVVVLGPCLSVADRALMVRRLAQQTPQVPLIDLGDPGPCRRSGTDEPSALASAVELALS